MNIKRDNRSPKSPLFKPASALDVDQDRMLESLERATPVRLIGTFDNLTTTYIDEPIAVAIANAEPQGFDFLPVRERRCDAIVGLLATHSEMHISTSSVRDRMEYLNGRNLIAADAPLLHFIYEADTCPCRLILDGAQITGLVTLSDIQKLPVPRSCSACLSI